MEEGEGGGKGGWGAARALTSSRKSWPCCAAAASGGSVDLGPFRRPSPLLASSLELSRRRQEEEGEDSVIVERGVT